MHRYVHLACFVLSALLIWACTVQAEDKNPSAKHGAAAAEFDRTMTEFKDILAEMGVLQTEYRKADGRRRAEINKQWKQLIEKGDILQPKLISTAEQAYTKAPNADKKVTDLLVDVLIGDIETRSQRVQTDDFERAMRIGKLLAENNCEDARAYNAAGVAAFALSHFDLAQEYLTKAKAKHAINPMGESLLESIPHYKDVWAKERKIRAAEDKADDLPVVLLKTTKGDIKIALLENEAPNAVANFVSLVEKGYYDGLTFHRVLPGFMAQGGCPDGTGTGGPGYNIPCECHQPNHRLHFRGSLSMAHAGRDTGGSQFFLTFLPTSHLDGRHTVFGRVTDGFDVLTKLQRRDPSRPNALEPDKIIEAKVLKKRDHKYVPKKV